MKFAHYYTLITAFLLLSIASYSQEATPPGNPGESNEQPTEMLAMMQCEVEMTKDENMLIDLYHKDIEIYQIPGKLLAKGIDEALNYWKQRFKSQGELGIEVVQIIQSDNRAAVKIKRTNTENNKTTVSIFMIEAKNSKLYRIYY